MAEETSNQTNNQEEPKCEADQFQGIRFYDGVSFGYLRLKPGKVELLIGENYEYAIDTSIQHTYRLTAKGQDIRLYIDGVLAINAEGKFTQKTAQKLIEFGSISGRDQELGSEWESFKYSVQGSYEGSENGEYLLNEVMTLPGGSIGSMKAYKGDLYVSYEPDDPSESSSVYRMQEGFEIDKRTTFAITKSNVSTVVVDPSRPTNLFGTSGKFIGTEKGIQYLAGGKVKPFDFVTDMGEFPQNSGWLLEDTCVGSAHNLFNRVLTIDTRDEKDKAYLKFVQGQNSFWSDNIQNKTGWTVESVVRVSNDSVSTLDDNVFYTPSDYLFVIENSTEMSSGNRLAYRDYMLKSFMKALNRRDYFKLITFDGTSVNDFNPLLLNATAENIQVALDYFDNLDLGNSGADMRQALTYAVGVNTRNGVPAKIIYVGSGEITDTIPYTQIAQAIDDVNLTGKTIFSVIIGSSAILGDNGSLKQQAFEEVAQNNSSQVDKKVQYVQDLEVIDQKTGEIWEAVNPTTFDWTGLSEGRSFASDPRSSFIQNAGENCNVSNNFDASSINSGVPEDDGLNAPSIVINDGTYEEIIQFFEKGIRLKYSKAFAALDLASQFHTIRILGKGTAIAVYAKADSDTSFRRVIFLPNGLFVKAANVGSQESPSVVVDESGIQHVVWSDSRSGNWQIMYSKGGVSANTLAKGVGYSVSDITASALAGRSTTSDPVLLDVIRLLTSRPGFNLPPLTLPNLDKKCILSPTATFKTNGVQSGDTIVFFNFRTTSGNQIHAYPKYTIDSVLDEAVLLLRTDDDVSSLWDIADFIIYRGNEAFIYPIQVSAQTLDSTEPFILIHSDGDMFVAYENNSGGVSDIYVRRGTFGATSAAFKETARITQGNAINKKPRMVELLSEKIFVVWERARLDGTNSQIFFTILDQHKIGSQSCFTITSMTPEMNLCKNPDVATCSETAYVVFEQKNSAGKTDVYALAFNEDSEAQDIINVTADIEGNNTNPTVAAVDGKIKIAWENDLTGIKEIFFTEGRCFDPRFPVPNFSVEDSDVKLTELGRSIGLAEADVTGGTSRSFFSESFGMAVLETDGFGNNITLAVRERSLTKEAIGTNQSSAGGIVVTGHDTDAAGLTSSDARNLLNKFINYVTKDKVGPRVLYITSLAEPAQNSLFPGQVFDYLSINYDIAHVGEESSFDYEYGINTITKTAYDLRSLALVDINANSLNYDAVVIASDVGGWLRQEENDVLSERATVIYDYVASGGGLVVLSQCGCRTASNSYPGVTNNKIGMLPFIISRTTTDGLRSGSIILDDVITQITSSRGNSTRPSITCDALGNTFIAYENDRIRPGFKDVYVSWFDARKNEWISSGRKALDTRIETFSFASTKPKVAADGTGSAYILMQLDLNDNGKVNSAVGSILFAGFPDTDSVVGYFPLDDKSQDEAFPNRVYNRIRTPLDVTHGESSIETSLLHIESGQAGLSLFNPEDQGAFDINQDDKTFSIPKELIGSSGSIEFWMTPHWPSTDDTERVLFGNANIGHTAANTMSLSIGPDGSANALTFRIVDEASVIRETKVTNDGETRFEWGQDETVHVRVNWDSSAIGSMRNVSFRSSLVGLAVGDNGSIYRTTDGGQNWNKVDSGTTYELYSVDFVNSTLAFVSGEFGTIMKSVDDGQTWTKLYPNIEVDINSIFLNSITGTVIAVGNSGTVLRSTDNGDNWTLITLDSSDFDFFPDLLSVGTGYNPTSTENSFIVCGRRGSLFVSFDDGQSFSQELLDFNYNLNAVSRTHQTTEYSTFVVGDYGKILKTTDVGFSFDEVGFNWTTGNPNLYGVSHNEDSDKVYVVGQNGSFARNDGGAINDDWVEIKTAFTTQAIRSIDAYKGGVVADEVVVVAAGGTSFVSSDSGNVQTYYTVKSGAMEIFLNGKEVEQTKTNDVAFAWNLSTDLVFGNFPSGDKTANSIFDELYIHNRPVNGSFLRRGNLFSFRADYNIRIFNQQATKRIEFGSISEKSKNRSHWAGVNIYSCGPREPVMHFQWNSLLGLQDDVVRDMIIDKSGFLWIATENGVCRFNAKEASQDVTNWISGISAKPNSETKYVNFNGDINGFTTNSINCITVDQDNDVWAGTPAGLIILERSKSTYGTDDPTKSTNTDDIDPNAKWTTFTIEDGLPSNNVLSIISIEGIILVGTDKGLCRIIKKNSNQFEVEASQEPTTTPTTTTPTEEEEEETPEQFEVANFAVKDGLSSNLIQALAYDQKLKEFWIGTDRGVSKYDGKRTFSNIGISEGLIDNDVSSIFIDNGTAYIGTSRGLSVIDGKDIFSYPASMGIGSGSIKDITQDENGAFWMATSTGLVEFTKACGNGKFTKYDSTDGLIGDPNVVDFLRYKILGEPIPYGACDKALVIVTVNNKKLLDGYTIVPQGPFVVFSTPRSAADKVDVYVHEGWRKIKTFSTDSLNRKEFSVVDTTRLSFNMYKKRFQAGEVSLGGNRAEGSSGSPSMYFVAVKALNNSSSPVSSINTPPGIILVPALSSGVSVYSDQTENLSLVPSEVKGLQYLATLSADEANQSDAYLSFELNADSIVYVCYDSKATDLPGWLRTFEPVTPIFRVSDMETFTDASTEEKLYVAMRGTNGCVYEILQSEDACDISDSIALDANPPEGCAKITRINSPTSVTLELTATDAVTGVADVQVSTKEDFSDATWVPFRKNYILQVPPASLTDISDLVEITDLLLPAGAKFGKAFKWKDTYIITTKNPGRLYKVDPRTAELSVILDTGESEITSLADFGSVLLIGTGPNGRAFSWDGTGTILNLLDVPGGERISAIAVFDSRAFFGTFPDGKIYEMDVNFNVQLFTDTQERSVNGFAAFGGKLYWATSNDTVSEGDILYTTTNKGHRHIAIVQAGQDIIGEVNVSTSLVKSHIHSVVNGDVRPEDDHDHLLGGSKPGRVYRYDLATGLASIVHSNQDWDITTIVSTSLDAQGLMFIGTYPNGNILRFVPEDGIFIKSFSTPGNDITTMKVINGNVFAASNDDVFQFDGRRWVFFASPGEKVNDILEFNGNVLMVTDTKIQSVKIITDNTVVSPTERDICAFVRFRDVAGNVTKILDTDGNIVKCYNPCTKDSGGTTPDEELPAIVHRITEIDDNAQVLGVIEGPESFFSAKKIEQDKGVYESEVFNGTNSLVQWVKLTWIANTPAGTAITFAVRSGKTISETLASEWSDEYTATFDLTGFTGQYLQFRATLLVDEAGAPSPELYKVDIQMRTSQAVHFFTTNFSLPDTFTRGILTYNGCINPPVTDVVFGITGNDSVDFSDYYQITPNKIFELPEEFQGTDLRVGIKFISSPDQVAVVDEFALLFSLANDAMLRLNLTTQPATSGSVIVSSTTASVITETVQGHTHVITYDSSITDKTAINGTTSINAGHSHEIVNGVLQPAAGHTHDFELE